MYNRSSFVHMYIRITCIIIFQAAPWSKACAPYISPTFVKKICVQYFSIICSLRESLKSVTNGVLSQPFQASADFKVFQKLISKKKVSSEFSTNPGVMEHLCARVHPVLSHSYFILIYYIYIYIYI